MLFWTGYLCDEFDTYLRDTLDNYLRGILDTLPPLCYLHEGLDNPSPWRGTPYRRDGLDTMKRYFVQPVWALYLDDCLDRQPSDALDNLPPWWFRHATSASHWAGIRSSSIRTSNNIKISWGFYVPQRLYLTLNGKQAFPYWVNTSVTIPVRKVYVYRYTHGKLSVVQWNLAPLISIGTIKPTLE